MPRHVEPKPATILAAALAQQNGGSDLGGASPYKAAKDAETLCRLGNRAVREWFEQQNHSHLRPAAAAAEKVRREATILLERHVAAQTRHHKPPRITIATDASARNRHRGTARSGETPPPTDAGRCEASR